MGFKDLASQVVSQINSALGDDVTYTPVDSDPVTIKGVFTNAFILVDNVESLKPVLRIDLSDLEAAPTKGDQVTINGTEYSVTESQNDGFGGSTLILQELD